jgi:magnesium-transporting ATPase (P-type)
MSLSKKVKVGLDETRILILGSQILLGFQFQGAFRPAFETVPLHSRLVWVAALGLITLTVALLITPSVQHRIVEKGHDTKRLLGVIRGYAGLSLAPFALTLGADLFLAVEPVLGSGPGIVAGSLACGLAFLFWYGLEALKSRTTGDEERAMTSLEPEHEHTSLETKVEQMLTEARVILPGAQALLGFQLVITFSESFEKLPFASKIVHLVSLSLLALTMIWLMAPAAFHRIVYAGEDTAGFLALGSRFVLAASVTLALGISAELGVVVAKVVSSSIAGETAATASLILLLGLWHVYPEILRRRLTGAHLHR